MGRTERKRLRKKKEAFQKLHKQNTVVLDDLKSWMLTQNWLPKYDLVPHIFPETGRGLMASKSIASEDVLLGLPKRLLITTFTVSQSYISQIFLPSKLYEAQCVLATFLVYEKHSKAASKWKLYLNTLPDRYSNPEFCSKSEKETLPELIKNQLDLLSKKLNANYRLIMESVKKMADRNCFCPHCNLPFDEIITYREFAWGYYTVNSRAVYLNNKENTNITVKDDNLALAPFLDLFNHACETIAVADLVERSGSEFYEIKTLKSYKQGSQVFINYGAHSNLKLYMEYGFFIPNNPLDEIKFEITDIKKCANLSESASNFLRFHKINECMAFNSQGLSYNARNALFVSTTTAPQHYWKEKIFREKFDSQDSSRLRSLGLKILNLKKIELKRDLENMKRIQCKSESFSIAVSLVKEFLSVLEKCSMKMCVTD